MLGTLVAASWAVLLFDAYHQAEEIPLVLSKVSIPDIPLWCISSAVLIVPVGIATGTFWQRKRIMEELPVVSKLMDRWFFEEAYGFLMNRLHAVYASIASSLLFGAFGIHVTHATSQSLLCYGLFFGSVFFSICMLVAVALSRRYPPRLR